MIRATVTMFLALAVGAAGGAATARTLELVEGAYELRLGDVALPTSAVGAVVFKPCADCDTVRLQVGSSTVYSVGGRPLPLADFLVAVDAIRETGDESDGTLVGVVFDLKTKRVTQIMVLPRR